MHMLFRFIIVVALIWPWLELQAAGQTHKFHGPFEDRVFMTDEGVNLYYASAKDIHIYLDGLFNYTPQQFETASGLSFDAYVSRAKRYDSFDEFKAAQQQLKQEFRDLSWATLMPLARDDPNYVPPTSIDGTRTEILNSIEVLPTKFTTKIDTWNAFATSFNEAAEVRHAQLTGDVISGNAFGKDLAALDRETSRLLKPASKAFFDFKNEVEAFHQRNWGLYYMLRNRVRLDVDYMSNIFLNEDHLRPVAVVEVRLKSPYGDIYHAKWIPNEGIAALERQREEAHRIVDALNKVIEDLAADRAPVRATMLKHENEWQRLNDLSHDRVVSQLWAEALLELVDVGMSAREAGPAAGYVIIFEGVYRGSNFGKYLIGRSIGSDYGRFERKIDEPVLSDKLIEARQLLSQGTPHAGAPSNVDYGQVSKDAAWSFGDAMVEDGRKSFSALIFEICKDRLAHSALRTSMKDYDYWAILNTMGYAKTRPRTQAQILDWFSGPQGAKLVDMVYVRRLMGGNSGDIFEAAADNLAGFTTKNVLASGATTAAINAGKVAAMTAYDLDRYAVEREKALTELKFLAARNQFRSIFTSQLENEAAIRNNMLDYAKSYAEMRSSCCKRTLAVTAGLDAAIKSLEDNYDEDLELELVITTDSPVIEPIFKIGEDPAFSEIRAISDAGEGRTEYSAPIKLGSLSNPNSQGTVSLAITAPGEYFEYYQLDGKPETFPLLDSVSMEHELTKWTQVETMIDREHQLPLIDVRTGIYFAVADVFGPEGRRIIGAPGLKISVLDDLGEVIEETETTDSTDHIFIKLGQGDYTLKMDIGTYKPVYESTCGQIYEQSFTIEPKDKLRFTATVLMSRASSENRLSTSAGPDPQCIRQASKND